MLEIGNNQAERDYLDILQGETLTELKNSETSGASVENRIRIGNYIYEQTYNTGT